MPREKKQNTPHKGFSRFLTLCFGIIFSLFVISYGAQQTVLKASFTKSILNQDTNQTAVVQGFKSVLNQRIAETGLPTTLTSDLVDEATIKNVVDQTVTNLYAGKTDPVPTSMIQRRITRDINTAMQSTFGMTSTGITNQVNQSIQDYMDANIQPVGNEVGQRLQAIRQTVKLVLIVSAVLSLALAIGILLLNHSLIRGWWYLGWGLGIAGLLDTLGAVLIKSNSQVPFAGASYNQYFQEIIQSWLKAASNQFLKISVIILSVGFLLILIFGLLKTKKKHQ